jgi:hypothetical protein
MLSRLTAVVRRLLRAPTVPKRTVDEVAGSLKYDGPPVTVADMERTIDDALRERWHRKSR